MKKKAIAILVLLIIVIILSTISIIKIKEKRELQLQKAQEDAEIIEVFENKLGYQIFLKDDADIDKVRSEISKIKEIKDINFVSKQDALELMKEKFKDNVHLLDGYEGENNIFPNSFIVKIEVKSLDDINHEYFENIKNKLERIDKVETVTGSYETYIDIYEEYGIKELKKLINEVEEKIN